MCNISHTKWLLGLPKQAYPAAEDASPAAVGKLFSEQMWTCKSLTVSLGSSFLVSRLRTEAVQRYEIQRMTQ